LQQTPNILNSRRGSGSNLVGIKNSVQDQTSLDKTLISDKEWQVPSVEWSFFATFLKANRTTLPV
jgi:hypothetical protein